MVATRIDKEKITFQSKNRVPTDKVELPTIQEAHKRFLLRNIRTISEILHTLYGSPNLGNKQDPLDELVYIHLSKKTNEKGYVQAFDNLANAFPKWKGLAHADTLLVQQLIESAGLGKQRAEEIQSNFRVIRDKFGEESLEPIRKWSNHKVFEFLTSLKGIGPKSALCVMMYSLGRKVFPVDTHVHTISERLGFLPPKLDHDQAQKALADIFPKEFRYGLHVDMILHGRRVCRRNSPACHLCNLDRFCLFNRKQSLRNEAGTPMVDVFCGAGGASLGLTDAGFSVKLAIDNDTKATDTYYLNHKNISIDQVLNCNIEELSSNFLRSKVKDKIFLLFGGPPCQGWSHIGKNHKNGQYGRDFLSDPKNRLYKQFIRQLDIFEPEYFVMENVPGLLSAHNGKYANMIKAEFREHNYESITLILNASDFGVAQNRIRVFFFGKRTSEKCSRAEAMKRLSGIQSFLEQNGSEAKISFRQVLSGLPLLKAGEGANVLMDNITVSKNLPDSKPHLIFNDLARKHMARDRRIYELLTEGEDYKEFSERCKDTSLLPYTSESFRTKFRKIDGNLPSPAIIAHLSRDANSYIHPDCNRGITVREGARIQSFPDDFNFLGHGFSQFILLGNAVPPKLAEIIGKSILENTKEG